MADDPGLTYGERAVSWRTVWNDLYPDPEEAPHDDDLAAEMHRLRGLVMAQACETEAVLAQILRRLNPSAANERPAGVLLDNVRRLLDAPVGQESFAALDLIHQAVLRRNRAVHGPVWICAVWERHGFGDGQWVPVISLMGAEAYDECDLRDDLALQQQATAAAVRLLRALVEADGQPTEH